jgi:cytochrome c-550 PedF
MTDLRKNRRLHAAAGASALALCASALFAHGDVAPQAVDTAGLPTLGDDWLFENPYRAAAAGEEVWTKAISIGDSGYNQNCARCHGLGAVSGGLAPDLRYLEAEEYGDEWFMERFQTGYTQNGITKMPAFGELLGQKAAWAIRLYVETRPGEGALDDHQDRLKEIRDQLLADDVPDEAAMKAELEEIAAEVYTESGAPLADSIAFRAAAMLAGSPDSHKQAAETLTVGLSAAQ